MEVDKAPVEPMASTSSLSLQDASGDATMTDAQPTTLTANAEGVQEGAEGTNVEVDKEKEPEPLKPGEEPDASETVYIQNLNEKVKLPILKTVLQRLFKRYGPVLDVVAHRNIHMRGQAFVSFPSKEKASLAVRDVKGFPLYGKPMQLSFAKTRSDAVVKKTDADLFEQHKAERLQRKKRSRRDNPIRRKFLAKKEAARKMAEAVASGAITLPTSAVPDPSLKARNVVQMPDEYLPPNKILFIQNLPDDTTKDALENLFRGYAGLIEVRTIPGRKGIAFVEYLDEASSSVAKDALHNQKLGENKMKVTFAKK